jgi:mRNA interferase RelE/StbE
MPPSGPLEFEVAVYRQVEKRLRKLPNKHRRQILARIAELEDNPRPHDSIKLKGSDYEFRLDMGEYRILYDVDYEAYIVHVRLLMQRGEGYGRYHL